MGTIPSWMRDNCWYCGCILIRVERESVAHRAAHPQMRTRDHFIPKSQRGRQTIPCCHQCNNRKGALTIEEFRARSVARCWMPEGGKFWFETQGFEWVE